jgi:putative membrane protein
MSEPNDPRVYFAAERTLLAWLRTGIAMIGLGFVVARFGLFLHVISRSPETASHLGSTVIGVILVVLGAASVALASWQHLRFCRGLSHAERPVRYWGSLSVIFGITLSVAGLVLAAYIALRSGLE